MVKILKPGLVRGSVLSTSSSATSYGLDALYNPLSSYRWRSSETNPWIVGNFGSEKTVSSLAMAYMNFRGDEYFRLRLADVEAELTSSPLLDGYFYCLPSSKGFHRSYQLVAGSQVNYGPVYNPGFSNFSIQFRLKRVSSGSFTVIRKRGAGAVDPGFEVYVNGDNKLVFKVADGTNSFLVETTETVSSSSFEMYTVNMSRSNNEINIFKGDDFGSSIVSVVSLGTISNGEDFVVGNSQSFDVDEIRFWLRVMTKSRLGPGKIGDTTQQVFPDSSDCQLYDKCESSGSSAADDSGNNNNGTKTNVTSILPDPDSSSDVVGLVDLKQFISFPSTDCQWFRIDFLENSESYVEIGHLELGETIDLDILYEIEDGSNYQGRNQFQLSSGAILKGDGGWKRQREFSVVDSQEKFSKQILPGLQVIEGRQIVDVQLLDDESDPQDFIFSGYLSLAGGTYLKSGHVEMKFNIQET